MCTGENDAMVSKDLILRYGPPSVLPFGYCSPKLHLRMYSLSIKWKRLSSKFLSNLEFCLKLQNIGYQIPFRFAH